MRSQFYMPVDGGLARVDVRAKLFAMLALIVICAMWGNWIFLAAVLVLEHIALLSTHIPANKTLKVWAFFLPIMLIVAITMLFTVALPGNTVWNLNGWPVSDAPLTMTAVVALRIADIAFAVFLMLFTTSRASWISGMAGLGLPYNACAAVANAIQFLPTYAATVHDLVLTQHIRGRYARIGKHNPFTRTAAWCSAHIRAIIAAPAHMRYLDRSRSIAALAHGAHINRGSAKRTYLHPAHMRLFDWLLVLLAIVCVALVVVMMTVLGW